MTDLDDLIALGVTVWTLEGQYDQWSMQHPTDRSLDEYEGQWVKATEAAAVLASLRDEVAAAEAKLADWQASQHYSYIGKDGKPVLARDLEARLEAAEDRIKALMAGAGAASQMALDAMAENKRLSDEAALKVEAAFREGFEEAPAWTTGNEPWDAMVDRYWQNSKARAALKHQ